MTNMRNAMLLTVFLLSASALPMFGDCSSIQTAINSCASSGCEIDLTATTYACGTTGLTVPSTKSGVVIKGVSPTATVLTYTGTGTFLSVGGTSGAIYNFTLKDVQLDISGAGSSAIGVLCTQCWWSRLNDVRVQSANGGS